MALGDAGDADGDNGGGGTLDDRSFVPRPRERVLPDRDRVLPDRDRVLPDRDRVTPVCTRLVGVAVLLYMPSDLASVCARCRPVTAASGTSAGRVLSRLDPAALSSCISRFDSIRQNCNMRSDSDSIVWARFNSERAVSCRRMISGSLGSMPSGKLPPCNASAARSTAR